MSVTGDDAPAAATSIPELAFEVRDARAVQYAAVPTLEFLLGIQSLSGHPVRSVLLDVQIQISARERSYDGAAGERLLELFGAPERWRTTLRTLPWTRTTLVVSPFTGATVVELPVPCSYDLEITAARYFAALEHGEVPLEFLFSGTVFYSDPRGALQTARISWNHEAHYRLPVALWRQAMERHFPGTAWLRLGRESFDRLCAYKARHAFESFDVTIESLLDQQVPR